MRTPAREEQFEAARQRWAEQSEANMREIIRLMCEGLCDKLISRRTGMAVSSIKYKRSVFMARHQIKSRTQLGVWAIRNGYYVIHEQDADFRQLQDRTKVGQNTNELSCHPSLLISSCAQGTGG